MTRDDDELTRAKMRHPASRHQMIRDVEAFAREAAYRGIDVTPLHTASDFHADVSRAIDQHGRPWQSKSRPRKAKWHNIIGTVAAYLLLVLALFIILSAVFASSARADGAVDAWQAEYGPAACDFLSQHPTVDGLSGVILGAEQMGLTAQQAGEAVASSVLDMCPDRTPILRQFVMRYGPVSNA